MHESPNVLSQPEDLPLLQDNHVYLLLLEDENFDEQLGKLHPVVVEALKVYGKAAKDIFWARATTVPEAREWLEHVNKLPPQARGFDAVFCDLKINKGTTDGYHGLEVAVAAARYKWPCAVLGYTSFAREDELLALKKDRDNLLGDSTLEGPAFDDFLMKQEVIHSPQLAIAKLARCLIPTAHFVEEAKGWSPPSLFVSRKMWCLLRELVALAFAPVAGWPLPKILLLGDAGAGKGMCARTYEKLLLLSDHISGRKRARPNRQTLNCATLVAAGEGGRVRLFGYKGAKAAAIPPTRGVFELTTSYEFAGKPVKLGEFAPDGASPVFEAGGVVFLDEFAEMDAELQAAVLNALEDGEFYRQDGARVSMGCHVVLATNKTAKELTAATRDAKEGDLSGRIRSDLLDRIPHVFRVPSLKERLEEIPDLVRGLALARLESFEKMGARHHGSMGGKSARDQGIMLEKSAQGLITMAVEQGLITSIRQLQSIAEVRPGENLITDSNLKWVIRKAQLMGIPGKRLVGRDVEGALDQPVDISWSTGGVEELARQLLVAFRTIAGRKEKQDIGEWIRGVAACLSASTKEQVSRDLETWKLGILRALCDLKNSGLKDLLVFDMPAGEKVWTQVVGPLIGSHKARSWFEGELKEKSRPILDRMAIGLMVVADGAWEHSQVENEDAWDAVKRIARSVYPRPPPPAAMDPLIEVLRKGEGSASLRMGIARMVVKHSRDSASAVNAVGETLERALNLPAAHARNQEVVVLARVLKDMAGGDTVLDGMGDRMRSDDSDDVRRSAPPPKGSVP